MDFFCILIAFTRYYLAIHWIVSSLSVDSKTFETEILWQVPTWYSTSDEEFLTKNSHFQIIITRFNVD